MKLLGYKALQELAIQALESRGAEGCNQPVLGSPQILQDSFDAQREAPALKHPGRFLMPMTPSQL